MLQPGDKVCLGVITGAHGVKGWVKIKPFTEVPDGVAAYGPLTNEDGSRSFTIMDSHLAKQMIAAKIKGIDSREAAEQLKRTQLFIARDKLPKVTEEETWYHADLIGLDAVLETGEKIGSVIAIYDFGAGDLLEIKPARGQSEFIPFTRAHVPGVDIAQRKVTIVPLPGMFGRAEDAADVDDKEAG